MTDILGDKPVLLIIDMQHDFIDDDAPFPCVGVQQIIPKIKRVAEESRKAGIPVIYVREIHRADLSDLGRESDPWHPPHCIDGTRGVEIIEELAPEEGDYLIEKRRWTAFYQTDLDLLLHGLNADTLILTGVATNACVLYTAYNGWERDYHIRLIKDCTAAGNEEEYVYGLKAVEYFQADGLITAEDYLNAIQ